MKNAYSIRIEWNVVYECIISLYAYIHEKERKHFQLGNAWKEETKQMLPDSFADELADERWEVLHRLVLLVAQSPQKHSVEAFLGWLESISPGEIYERLAPWVDTIPLNLGELRDHSVSLLARWNEHYFSRIAPAILDSLERSAADMTELAQSMSPVELVDHASNGLWIEPVPDLREVVLIPQYHCAPAAVLDFYRGLATCLYPVGDAGQTRPHPLAELLPLTQCLADEKRLHILRCLAEKNCTLGELQQQVSLAKSTVHHHVTALRRAGLIRAHYAGSTNVSSYSLRESFIERLPVLLRSFLHNRE
ncbi:winged helix-turn-helix domain-containing protein [Brevibacillus gelatini]|uniref:ArsR/SmtB family transcription factor n=1 Tax=Brevibacillus gelatini TaxID=1655277 RepID=UPI003D8136FA